MSRFHPIYSTVCETFPGERNSFFFRDSVVKSTFDLVNARPRSFDDVQPDRDANTLGKPSELVKPWARKARSFGSALVRRRGKRLESNRWAFHGWIRGSILPTDFPPVFFRAIISSKRDFSREIWILIVIIRIHRDWWLVYY